LKNRVILSLTILFLFLSNCFAFAETKPIAEGAPLPGAIFQDHLSKEERSYLGLSLKTQFSLKDMNGTLLLIEIFSTYCTSCPKNVPVINTIYSAVEDDPVLKGKVKLIGIAVGNTGNEIESFKREYKVLYPVLGDLLFTLHKALGNPRVPVTILVKNTAKGNIVVHVRQGVLDSPDDVLKKIRGLIYR